MRKINKLKRRLKKGETVIGTWCILPSASVANVIGTSGLDFLVIDMEHGPISYETAEDMVRTAESEDCSPLVRVPKNDDSEILRALDIGAHGVIVPHINSVQQRKLAIESIKYFPLGRRGLSPFTRAGGYDPDKPADHAENENKETMSILLVEGKEGIDNIEAIMDDNIDVIYIGVYDLSQSLGLPGQVERKEVKKCLESCVKKARKIKISVGSFTNNFKTLKWFKDIGIQFITYSLDSTEICRSFKHIVKEFKKY